MDSLSVAGVRVRSDCCAETLAVRPTAARAAVEHAVSVITIYIDNAMAFREDWALENVTGNLCCVFLFWVHRAWRLDRRCRGAGLSCSPGVGEGHSLCLDLSGACAEVVVCTAVEVTAHTAHLTAVAWLQSNVDAHRTVPLNGESMFGFDVSVETSLYDLVQGLVGRMTVLDNWGCSTDKVDDCVVHFDNDGLCA